MNFCLNLQKPPQRNENQCEQSMAHGARNFGDLDLWHKRLGHLNLNDVLKLSSMVDGVGPLKRTSKNICESCIFGKHSRKSFPPRIEERSTRVLELIHSDVCGPLTPPTWDEKRYFVTFVDDHTHFLMVYLIANKSDVLRSFKEYKQLVETLFERKIVKLMCDNGGEYRSNEFKGICSSSGIQLKYTIPHTPQLNGVAERINRTLMERARTMIHESGLPKQIWGEAVLCTTYLLNRNPTRALTVNKTPAELWFGRKPNLSNLRIFGCTAYAHVPEVQRNKLDVKSKRMVLVGYATNGYRLWDPERSQVITRRDVIFNENRFIFNRTNEIYERLAVDTSISDDDESESLKSTDDNGENVDNHQLNDDNVLTPRVIQQSKTSSGRTVQQPDLYGDWVSHNAYALNAESFVDDTPNTFADIENRDDSAEWMKAVRSEMESLIRNETWTLMELPKNRKVVDCKWVFKRKRNEMGQQTNYKARLVARGFTQRHGFDFDETYAPVARITTLRVLLSLAVQRNSHIHQMDVKTAFLNGKLNEEIYMRQPEGFVEGELVCKLNKSLYGLKQASRMWNQRFHEVITKMEFKRSDYDQCLYMRTSGSKILFLLLYVDDLILVGDNIIEIEMVKPLMCKEFEMRDMMEMKTFLGITIDRDMSKGILLLDQKLYLEDVLRRFKMENCKAVATPMERNLQLKTSTEDILTKQPYKELIGCLMYAAITTRPDLCAAVNYFSQFQCCATDDHWIHLKRILRYIKGTTNLRLKYTRDDCVDALIGYADANWANCINDRKSVSGYVFNFVVSWMTRKQGTVALSSTEAEYIALSIASCEAIWLNGILEEMMNQNLGPIIIFEDNQACISIAQEPKEHQRMKHVDGRYNFVRDLVLK